MIFHEIYGTYYRVVGEILKRAQNGRLDRALMEAVIREKGFLESGLEIPDAFLSGRWPLLDENGETCIRHTPKRPLTDLERMWLKAILQDPRVKLFAPPEEDLSDVPPLFDPDFFVWFDRSLAPDPFEDPDYIRNFRTVLRALKERRTLYIRYMSKSGERERFLTPERLEYSPKDDKFRLLARAKSGPTVTVNLSTLREVRIGREAPASAPERGRRRQNTKEVSLLLTNERNALERAMLHFSDLQKETERLDGKQYRIRLYYRREDETEILIRVLSFGPMLFVEGPEAFRDLVQERLQRQLDLDREVDSF